MQILRNPDIIANLQQYEFKKLFAELVREISNTMLINRGRVHAQDVSTRPEYAVHELSNVVLSMNTSTTIETLQRCLEPNLPWAEDHFQERVGGKPLNPAPSEAWWPFAQKKNEQHKEGHVFSHTYPERMWPKYTKNVKALPAGWHGEIESRDGYWVYANTETPVDMSQWREPENVGIRYKYGDLNDVVEMIAKDPFTRQAYLPIWFPEDTGAVEGQRVPCSLGYHFIRRMQYLDCQYYMRSCDLFRHFTDDVYMAARLLQWMCEQLWEKQIGDGHEDGPYPFVGRLTIYISNLHCFKGDEYRWKS
jgi:hypothetical protein